MEILHLSNPGYYPLDDDDDYSVDYTTIAIEG